MKVLVTGGAGYIGSHVVKLLGKRGDQVVVVDDLSTGFERAVLYGRLEVMDFGDVPAMRQLFEREKFDAIFHFAASTSVPESVQNPQKYYLNNAKKSFDLIELAREMGVRDFIFSSTAAVYGTVESGMADEHTPTHPISPYGRTKLMVEQMLADLAYTGQLRYISLRYFNVAGADVEGEIGQSTKDATHLIKVACEAGVGKRESFHIFGTDYDTPDGTCIRDFIHVTDLAQAHIDALSYLQRTGESQVFNCGYGRGYSVRDVVDTVRRLSGGDFKVVEDPRREGDLVELCARAEKIQNLTGWKPLYDDLDRIIQTSLDWESKS